MNRWNLSPFVLFVSLPLVLSCGEGASRDAGFGGADAGGGAAGDLGKECDSCRKTADCEAPLGCKAQVCVHGDRPDACGGAGGGEAGACETDGSLCGDICCAGQAAACGAVGAGGELAANLIACVNLCDDLSLQAKSCVQARIDNGDCDDGAFIACLDPGEGEGEGPDEFCDDLCAAAARPSCGAVGVGGFFGNDLEECAGECAAQSEVDPNLVSCLSGLIEDGRCEEEELEFCAVPGGGEEACDPLEDPECEIPGCEGPDDDSAACQCTLMCGAADECGLVHQQQPSVATDVTECIAGCLPSVDQTPEAIGCVMDNFDDEDCTLESYMACFGGEIGGDLSCDAFCDAGEECGIVGDNGSFAASLAECADECGQLQLDDLDALQCMNAFVQQGDCGDADLNGCFDVGGDPGGDDDGGLPGGDAGDGGDPGGDQGAGQGGDEGGDDGGNGGGGCPEFCDLAAGCGIVGPNGMFAQDIPDCLVQCDGMAAGNAEMVQCLVNSVTGGCDIQAMQGCNRDGGGFGGDEGGGQQGGDQGGFGGDEGGGQQGGQQQGGDAGGFGGDEGGGQQGGQQQGGDAGGFGGDEGGGQQGGGQQGGDAGGFGGDAGGGQQGGQQGGQAGGDDGGGQPWEGDCLAFCGDADDCGMLHANSQFATDEEACEFACLGMRQGVGHVIGCLADAAEANDCADPTVEACLNLGQQLPGDDAGAGLAGAGGDDGGQGGGDAGGGQQGGGGQQEGGEFGGAQQGGDDGGGNGGQEGPGDNPACGPLCAAAADADCGLVGGFPSIAPDVATCENTCAIFTAVQIGCVDGVIADTCSIDDFYACFM